MSVTGDNVYLFLNELDNIINSIKKYMAKYHEGHVLYTIALLYTGEPLGRTILSKKLCLGETSVRGLLSKMTKNGIVKIDRVAGSLLTEKGKDLGKQIINCIEVVEGINILDWSNAVLLIIKCLSKDTILKLCNNVLDLRDKIISLGAKSVLITAYIDSKWFIPGLPQSHNLFTDIVECLKTHIKKLENNILAICIVFNKAHCIKPEVYRIAYIIMRST